MDLSASRHDELLAAGRSAIASTSVFHRGHWQYPIPIRGVS